jgi:hypothetical protein
MTAAGCSFVLENDLGSAGASRCVVRPSGITPREVLEGDIVDELRGVRKHR